VPPHLMRAQSVTGCTVRVLLNIPGGDHKRVGAPTPGAPTGASLPKCGNVGCA